MSRGVRACPGPRPPAAAAPRRAVRPGRRRRLRPRAGMRSRPWVAFCRDSPEKKTGACDLAAASTAPPARLRTGPVSAGTTPDGLLRAAARLRDAGRVAEAIEAYRQALALRPDAPNSWYNLARLQREAGQPEA